MLPAANRMRRAEEFALAFDGFRARCGRVALSLGSSDVEDNAGFRDPKVGFIVSKKVGNSVVRHRMTRQFRHIVRLWIDNGVLGSGEYLVIRALPGSAGTQSSLLADDMMRALEKCRLRQKKREAGEE